MTSARQRAPNRSNARRRRGPATAAGKRKASLNALTHGLTARLPDPVASRSVERLAQVLAAGAADPTVLAVARRAAEAEIDWRRVRIARQPILEAIAAALEGVGHGSRQGAAGEPDGAALADLLRQLQRLERYERRALSRRKSAIRAWDRARLEALNLDGSA